MLFLANAVNFAIAKRGFATHDWSSESRWLVFSSNRQLLLVFGIPLED